MHLRALMAVLFACFMSLMQAQAQTNVTGTVVDAADEPMVGASVIVVGSQAGTATDIDGNFTIAAKQGQTLRVSYVGYKTQDVKISGTNLHIVMQEDNALLDEVVVIGYGSMSRKDVTGSISTVNAKDLNVGAYTDPGQLLQGKVPGLVVVQNSDPNGGVNSMTLRGASTLNGSTQPLYVVDGIPGVELNLVSPGDIESIDVLRDASATAIYGSKAANGVIIVTTKRGADGPARVNYSGYVAWDKIVNDHKMMTADQLRDYADRHGITLLNDQGVSTDWQKEVQRTGFAHNHNLSITGGNKSTSYTASINYIERDGAIKGVGNNLFTARSYVETKMLKDRLTIGLGVNGNVRNEWGVNRDGNNGKSVYNAMYYYSPVVPVRDEDGNYWSEPNLMGGNYNPLAMLYEDVSKSTLKRFQVTGKASLMIIDGLLLNANFSYQNKSRDYKEFHSHESELVTSNGQVTRETTSDVAKLLEVYANYDKTFAKKHKLALMAGYSWEQEDNGEGFKATGYDYYDDSLGWENIGMANKWDTDPVEGKVKATKRMISFYGRANYSFDSRYIIQAAVRRDGASVFGSNHKWATFPSASVAWRMTEESWMKGVDWLSDLKLRAGWGQSGNSNGFDIYTSRFFYNSGSRFDYVVDPETGKTESYKSLNAARNDNPDLKWETTTMLNLGVDFAFLNGRINGTIEYYNKTTKDMIWDYPVPTTIYPVSWITANVGKMRNRGIEVTINAVPIQGPFTWSTSVNLSHNQNRIVSVSNPASGFNAGIIDLRLYNPNLPNASVSPTQRIIEGQPIGTFYMPEWAGYDENGNSVFYVYDKTNEQTSGERLRDENGNFVTTLTPEAKDRVIVGNAQPKLTMGWNNNFTWKNWDLNLFFTGVFGQKIFNEPKAYYSYVGWVAAGKNILADVEEFQDPRDGNNCSIPSDRWLEDGSYFKLATATLGYTFRNCFNGWLRDIRLYVSCNNVFTITKYSGRDPEICLDGLAPGHDSRHDHFPRTRQVLVGASINF